MVKQFAAFAVVLSLSSIAQAVDVGVYASQVSITDTASRKSIKFAARDLGIQKGSAGALNALSGTFEVFYGDEPGNYSKFVIPNSGWKRNDDTTAQYQGSNVDRLIVKNGKSARLKAVALGDDPYWSVDLGSGRQPSDSGGLITVLSLTNSTDATTRRVCTRFAVADGSRISFRVTRDGGYKLNARRGVPVSCDRLSYFRMEPALGRGFFAAPWPNDIRLKPDGSLDMDNFPIPAGTGIVDGILSQGAAITKGFGTNSAIFFQASGDLDTATLPSPTASVDASSAVMLVNLDNPAAPRIPVLTDFHQPRGVLRPGDFLAVLPYPGHPLAGSTRYAVILYSGLHTTTGEPFLKSPLLDQLDQTWDASKPVDATKWAALKAQRDAVYAYAQDHTSWGSSNVIAFTVFTTQNVLAEMQAIAAAINAMPQPTPVSRNAGHCSGVQRTTATGQLKLPKFQSGTYPYAQSGGAIEIVDGKAVQQSTETVTFSITFPCGPAPTNGWPIMLFQDGTGGGYNSASISYMGGNIASDPLPYIVASIAPLYSGDREVFGQPPPWNQSEFLFFNYFNPLAARTNQLQQAAEMMYLRRVIEGLTLSAAETGAGGPVATDDTIELVAGHSQGALTIPQLIAVDPSFDGAFISAGGGGLYETIIHRSEVRILLGLVLGAGGVELDVFHPIVHAVQTFAEIGDAANYGPYAQNAHILSTSGLIDGCSPVEVASIVGTALGLQVANPIYRPVFGTASLESTTTTLPATGNLSDGRTGVTIQLDTGHFGTVTNPDLGRLFAETLAANGVPTVDLDPILSDDEPGCVRYDELP